MAKRTAVIDIGSNSARMVVFEKSSHLAFHMIKEVKSQVRIGEGAYENGGILQEIPLQRAFDALASFRNIIKTLKCQKTLCVATSAFRDAPNSGSFIRKIKKELDINIKIIDGKKEAYYGGVAAINHLMPIDEAVTMDIGGGSTELALIKNNKIIQTISLDVGTVRLKELFLDKHADEKDVKAYVEENIEILPENFHTKKLIVIGGTTRYLSKLIMSKINYPITTVHAFEYKLSDHINMINEIKNSQTTHLKDFGIKKDRIDTIREGLHIFEAITSKLQTEQVITSGAGVREGVYLSDLLRNKNHIFNPTFKLSLRSIIDRFEIKDIQNNSAVKCSSNLFDALEYIHQIDSKYKKELEISAKLYNIGIKLNFYQKNLHSFYFILNNLNYGFSHKEKILIAILIKYHMKKLPSSDDIAVYQDLLPDINIVNWLSFILSLTNCLHEDLVNASFEFEYKNHTLTIKSSKKLNLTKECIKKLAKPASFAIVLEE
ncbi:MAG: Ppx/GppA phosphatase family protein [Sulfurospirillaceae bacterium]|nr:Ppx/GppA phosphatase family protein [Sulfurospirillaceae bacterium]